MTKFRFKATPDAVEAALAKAVELLSQLQVDRKTAYKIRLVLDELLTNVVSYAYENDEGEIEIDYEINNDPRMVTILIIDEGKPFNPLEHEDPELIPNIAERPIGGLGLFIVKNSVDELDYQRQGNQNILTIKKKI